MKNSILILLLAVAARRLEAVATMNTPTLSSAATTTADANIFTPLPTAMTTEEGVTQAIETALPTLMADFHTTDQTATMDPNAADSTMTTLPIVMTTQSMSGATEIGTLETTANTLPTDGATLSVTTAQTGETGTRSSDETVAIGDVPTNRPSGLTCPVLPVSSAIGICRINQLSCSSDAACKAGDVCCRKGCGQECVRGCLPIGNCNQTCLDGFILDADNCTACACKVTPAPPTKDEGKGMSHKPRNGTCPEFKPSIGLCSADVVVEVCTFDSDCSGVNKCCRSGCGKSCIVPCAEPDCAVDCPGGYHVDSNNCATCQCISQVSTVWPDADFNTSPSPNDTLFSNYTHLLEMELRVMADKVGVKSELLLADNATLIRSLEEQLQSQFGLLPGQLKVLSVKAASKPNYVLMAFTLTPSNETGEGFIDSTVLLISQRTRDRNLWLSHFDKESGSYFKLRAVGMISIGGNLPKSNHTRHTLAIIVAIIGFLLLVVILSIIAFVNWRGDRRKKLVETGAQRHSSAVQYDGHDGTTFINPFVPSFGMAQPSRV